LKTEEVSSLVLGQGNLTNKWQGAKNNVTSYSFKYNMKDYRVQRI